MVLRANMSVEQELRFVLSQRRKMKWSEWYNRFLQTRWWKNLRKKVLERDNYSCVKCKSRVNLHVDHIVYPGFGHETPEHLQTLCWKCHSEKTKKMDLLAWKTYMYKPVDVKEKEQLFTVLRRG